MQLYFSGLQNPLGLVLSLWFGEDGDELYSSSLSHLRHFSSSSVSQSCALQGILSCLTFSCSQAAVDGSYTDTACGLPKPPSPPLHFQYF